MLGYFFCEEKIFLKFGKNEMMKTCIYGRSSDCRALPPLYMLCMEKIIKTYKEKNFECWRC